MDKAFSLISSESDPVSIHRVNGSLSNLKAKRITESKILIACSAPTALDGTMFYSLQNPESPKVRSSAKIYSSLYTRHWDSWNDPASRNSIWFGSLIKADGQWKLEKPGLVNALLGTDLECPVPPFGGTDHFDISPSGIVFVSRDPKLDPACYTKSDLYFLPISTWPQRNAPRPHAIQTRGLSGYTMGPKFSHDGRSVAFLRMKNGQYEADKTRLMLIPNIEEWGHVQEFYRTEDGDGGWDYSPSNIEWSRDNTELFISAEKHGRVILWKLPASPAPAMPPPEAIYTTDTVTGFSCLSELDHRLFITSSSLVDSACYSILDPRSKSTKILSSATKHGKSLGLSRAQCSDFWFSGCEDRQVHAWVMKPSTLSASKRYPLALLIHGGPQGAWLDSWSTRWNPAIFAEAGYIAVMVNPTGSTGYGQDFTDRIQNEWGGRPYEDLERCWEHIRANMPDVDVDNGVALGASYGGYMISGSPLFVIFFSLLS